MIFDRLSNYPKLIIKRGKNCSEFTPKYNEKFSPYRFNESHSS